MQFEHSKAVIWFYALLLALLLHLFLWALCLSPDKAFVIACLGVGASLPAGMPAVLLFPILLYLAAEATTAGGCSWLGCECPPQCHKHPRLCIPNALQCPCSWHRMSAARSIYWNCLINTFILVQLIQLIAIMNQQHIKALAIKDCCAAPNVTLAKMSCVGTCQFSKIPSV